jgi:hypothetical protein
LRSALEPEAVKPEASATTEATSASLLDNFTKSKGGSAKINFLPE